MSEALVRPKAVSLFSGGGGLDLGLEDAGYGVAFATDWVARACETLRANQRIARGGEVWFDGWFKDLMTQRSFQKWNSAEVEQLRNRLGAGLGAHEYLDGTAIEQRDIRLLGSDEILEAGGLERGAVELVAGGPPCQSFSRSGQRGSVDDERGQLFLEFVRVVDDLRPRWFLFENVKGLILTKTSTWQVLCKACGESRFPPFDAERTEPGPTDEAPWCEKCGSSKTRWIISARRTGGALDLIIAEFERIGYACHAKVLDAVEYGAPQHRERLFIVGSRDDEPFEFPAATHGDGGSLPMFPELNAREPLRTMLDDLFNDSWSPYHGTIDPDSALLWLKNVVRPHDEPVTWTLRRPSPTIGAHQSAKLAIAPNGVPPAQLVRQQWHVLGKRQGDTPPVPVEHSYLHDADLLKLQTFPASWFVAGTRMERAFQIGNAVPPVLGQGVAAAIMRASNGKSNAATETKNRVAASV